MDAFIKSIVLKFYDEEFEPKSLVGCDDSMPQADVELTGSELKTYYTYRSLKFIVVHLDGIPLRYYMQKHIYDCIYGTHCYPDCKSWMRR